MREILTDVERWVADGRGVAIARVIDVDGSGPREIGAAMAVNDEGEVSGSVSGGCVEGAVVEEALAVLSGRSEPHVESFGYSDEDAFAVGLTCGGTVHLFIETLDDQWPYQPLRDALRNDAPVALATVTDGPDTGAKVLATAEGPVVNTITNADLARVVARDTVAELEAGRTETRHYGPAGEAGLDDQTVFVESFAPPPRMIIFGAVDFTAALASVAKLLGYRVIVCDAREVFATRQRFPMADEVVVDWPDRYLSQVGAELTARDAVCVLTHDAKFDVPAILAALDTRVGYLGAMGSRRTQEDRLKRLQEAGVDEERLARLMAPIGIDIGARTPAETAVSICAEIIGRHTGRDGGSLREGDGPIHPRANR